MIDLPSTACHFPEPTVTSAHGKPERVAGLANRLAFYEHHAMELWFFRLRRMVDATPEATVDHEASLTSRIHATPSSCTGTVPSAALRFSAAENARGVGYRGSDTIPSEEKIEQGVQQMLAALLGIACPDVQSALRIGRCYGKFSGTSISPVKAMDKRCCHLRVELKIEVAHCSVLVQQGIRVDRRYQSFSERRPRTAPVAATLQAAIGRRRGWRQARPTCCHRCRSASELPPEPLFQKRA
jgi:hypothetical protein